jgi:hypothetical protein
VGRNAAAACFGLVDHSWRNSGEFHVTTFRKTPYRYQTNARIDVIDVGCRHTAKNRLANFGQMVCGVSGGPVGLASIFIKNGM